MTQKNNEIQDINTKQLSIQISLNGLSFCILDTANNTILDLKEIYKEKKQTPVELLDSIKHLFNTETSLNQSFNKVTVIHVNELATLVPEALFEEDNIADYLKLNSKILPTDFITYDAININETINVYVPYVNVNNYIYDKYGDFTYKHYSTILIESLLIKEKNANNTKLYINVNKSHFEIIVFNKSKLLFYNTFQYDTANDFIYYILFTIEQLNLNPETIILILLGDIQKDDALYNITYKYIRNVEFGNRKDTCHFKTPPKTNYSNFTLIKSICA